jgi:hypothetical protein
MKTCSDCGTEKYESCFYKNGGGRAGLRSKCKDCINKQTKDFYQWNKEQYSEYHKKRYVENKTEIRAKQREYEKKRLNSDIEFKIKKNLRIRMYCAIRYNLKSGSAVKDLGCSIDFFKEYIASMFQDGMTWDNYGEWHLDHIKPLSLFNLSDRSQYLEAANYKNIQPLWAKDNLTKSDKYVTI